MTDAQPVGVASARVPASVTSVAVTALVLASLGMLGAVWGVLGLVIQLRGNEMIREMGGAGSDPNAMRMMEPMLALQEQIFWPTVATHVMFGLAAVTMGAAGVVVLMRHPRTPLVAPALFALTGALSLLGTACEMYIQHAVMAGMRGVMAGAMGEGVDAAAGSMMDQMIGVQQALGYGCAGGWLLVKLSFVIGAALHLRKPEIAGLFGGPVILGARGD